MTIPERQHSAIRKMMEINQDRQEDEKYKLLLNKNGRPIPAKDGGKGHIIGYACYEMTPQQKSFKEEYKDNTVAFTKAAKICTKDNGYETAEERRECISDFIKRAVPGI